MSFFKIRYCVTLFLLCSYLLSCSSKNQEEKQSKENKPDLEKDREINNKYCILGIDSAKKDIMKGNVKYLFYEMSSFHYPPKEFVDSLRKKYHLEIEGLNVEMGFEQDRCYKDLMDSVIASKYGDLFLRKLDSLTAIFTKMRELPDKNGVYYYWDTQPEFIGGSERLNGFFEKNFNKNIMKSNSGTVFIELGIDSLGFIIHSKIIRGIEQSIDSECIRVVRKMPKWKPGIVKGNKVKSLYMLRIEVKEGQIHD